MSSLEGAPSASESEMCTNEGIFKPKKKPKIIRVLTVFAYVLSVSMAAILLSVYYIFVWKADASPSNRYNEVQQVENPCGPRAYKFMDHPGLTFEESGPTLKNLSSVATESSANDTVNSRGKREIKTGKLFRNCCLLVRGKRDKLISNGFPLFCI